MAHIFKRLMADPGVQIITCSAHYEHGGWDDNGMESFFINNGWHSTLSPEDTLLRAKRLFMGRVEAIYKLLNSHTDMPHDLRVTYKLYAPDLESAEKAIELLKAADVSEDCIMASVVPVDAQGSQIYPQRFVTSRRSPPPLPPFVIGWHIGHIKSATWPPPGQGAGFSSASYRPGLLDRDAVQLVAESRFGRFLKEARRRAEERSSAEDSPMETYKIYAPNQRLADKAIATLKKAGVPDSHIEARVVPVFYEVADQQDPNPSCVEFPSNLPSE